MKTGTSIRARGRIIAFSDDIVTIKSKQCASLFKSGQSVVVGIPYERKTALGKVLNVAEIIAHGKVSAVSDDVVVIKSKRSNPIISKTSLRDNYGKDRVLIVDVLN
jgi:hypothetical protein